jgi:phage repressor protein C with HTH and peptisase S24 domain
MGGPDGRFILNGETMGFILAPTSLSNIRNAYAVYVVGESMEPRYEAGEVCWVNPHIPVRAGHYVVVQIAGAADGDPPEGYVKRFVARTADVLRLEQFNPPKVIEIPNEKVLSVHRIVGSGEAN